MLERLKSLARSRDALDGVVMAGATLVAGGFDYLVLVAAGLLLTDLEAIAFLAVMNLLKIAEQLTWVIRNVVAYYTAELSILPNATIRTGTFLRGRWRWAWQWGLLTAVLFALVSPFIGRLINVDSTWALLAAGLALLLFFVRPVTDGALQGVQNFLGLGSVAIVQSVCRFGLTVGLILLGLNLVGAVVALPVASSLALVLAIWLLRPYFRAPKTDDVQKVSLRYSLLTLVGLGAFALLVYADAILVNRLLPEVLAVQYTPVNILGRMNLFVPIAIGMVLFPKATQRHAQGKDARPYLLLALAATLIPGLLLTAVYFLLPGLLTELVFRGQYPNPGSLLGLVGLATTLFAGINIWLNYALSAEKRPFVITLVFIVIAQITAITFFHDSLQTIALIMLGAGLLGNVAGAMTLLHK